MTRTPSTPRSVDSLSDSLADRIATVYAHGVVPGLMFLVPQNELRVMLKQRAEYHRGRASAKRDELPKLQKQAEELGESHAVIKGYAAEAADTVVTKAANFSNYGTAARPAGMQDAIQQIGQAIDVLNGEIKTHDGRAAAFDLLASSLFAFPYVLSYQDMVAMELAPGR